MTKMWSLIPWSRSSVHGSEACSNLPSSGFPASKGSKIICTFLFFFTGLDLISSTLIWSLYAFLTGIIKDQYLLLQNNYLVKITIWKQQDYLNWERKSAFLISLISIFLFCVHWNCKHHYLNKGLMPSMCAAIAELLIGSEIYFPCPLPRSTFKRHWENWLRQPPHSSFKNHFWCG